MLGSPLAHNLMIERRKRNMTIKEFAKFLDDDVVVASKKKSQGKIIKEKMKEKKMKPCQIIQCNKLKLLLEVDLLKKFKLNSKT